MAITATYVLGTIDQIDDEIAENPFRFKFWGRYRAVPEPLSYLSKDGSITLMAGAVGVCPPSNAAAYAASNCALEGLGRALAVELAPVRVNTISPVTIDGALWSRRPAEVREAAFSNYARDALISTSGTEDEVADRRSS